MSPIPEAFVSGIQIRQARDTLLLPQALVAEYLGINRSTLNRMENGGMVLQRHTGLHAALLFHHLTQAGVPAPTPRGRPASAPRIPANANVSRYRLANGAPLTFNEALALPVGTRLWCMTAKGREPIDGQDQWRELVRSGNPAQPLVLAVPDMVIPPPPPLTGGNYATGALAVELRREWEALKTQTEQNEE